MNKFICNVILLLGIMPCVVMAMDNQKLCLSRVKPSSQRTRQSFHRTKSSPSLASIPEESISEDLIVKNSLIKSKKHTRQLARASRVNDRNEGPGKKTISAQRLLLKASSLDPERGKKRRDLNTPIAQKIAFYESIKTGDVEVTSLLLSKNNRLRETDPLAKKLYDVMYNRTASLWISSSDVQFLSPKAICVTARSLAVKGQNKEFVKLYDAIVEENLQVRKMINGD